MKWIVGVVVLLVVIGAISNHHDSGSSSGGSPDVAGFRTANGPAPTSEKSNIYLLASESFCVPTGIDDVYTGDGHVTFYLAFRNSGDLDGSANAVPVRHYSDGEFNESALDAVSVDIAAGETERFHTTAMTYKAHEHEVISCGVIVDGRDEVGITAR